MAGVETISVAEGGFRFIPAVFQYAAGVMAEPGYTFLRLRFAEPLPLAQGFARIAALLQSLGRPQAAFAACELRSPTPFTEEGFAAFNQRYAAVLQEWGIFRHGHNPVARSNVCPALTPPAEPCFYAFTLTMPAAAAMPPAFVISGSGEVPEGVGRYREHIVAAGDVSPSGLLAKARFVVAEMERRMACFGVGWKETTAVQLYTVHDIHPLIEPELVARGAARHGLLWHYCRPPVEGLEFEMDCRGVWRERILPPHGGGMGG